MKDNLRKFLFLPLLLCLTPYFGHPSDETSNRQSEYDPDSKTYTAWCAICGKVKSQEKPFFDPHLKTIAGLQQSFFYCDTCGRWVCEDCYLINDGIGNGIGMCIECAEERGIKGLTITQFEKAWPHIRNRR